MSDLVALIGKFHPLIVHLPIGILIYAFLKAVYQHLWKKNQPKDSLAFALWLSNISAVGACITGLILADDGGYNDRLITWHKYAGFAVASLSLLVTYLYYKKASPKAFLGVFTLAVAALGIAGHFGGSLTHGEDFLSNKKPTAKLQVDDPLEAKAFADVVMPIVEQKCVSCHNSGKDKGSLMMHNIDGWMKGGETGKLFVEGDAENSLLIQRILLDLDHEEHMPPKGKTQVTDEEKEVLKWWVDGMQDFNQAVGDLPPNAKVISYVASKMAPEMVLSAEEEKTLSDLQQRGIGIFRTASGSAELELEYARSEVRKSDIKALAKLAPFVVSMNFAESTLPKGIGKQLSKFENLQILNLANSNIDNQDLLALKTQQIRSLNLYNTKVDADIFDWVKSQLKLEKLYLWQSDVDEKDFAELRKTNPNLQLIDGFTNMFEATQLSKPILNAKSDLFRDSLVVVLSTTLGGAEIHYTLDGTEPTEESPAFKDQIVINNTATVKAMVVKEGWKNSDVLQKTYMKAGKDVASTKFITKPADRYYANGEETLTNLVKGSVVITDGEWLGFLKEDAIFTMDLLDGDEVSSVAISALTDDNNYIFYPRGITVEKTDDGKNYTKIGEITMPEQDHHTDLTRNSFVVDVAPTTAKRLRISIKNQGTNPSWHAAPGANSWVFIDEVVIN